MARSDRFGGSNVMPVDPFYILRRSPAGSAALARVLHKPTNKYRACWLLRVSSARLKAMLQKGEVFIKSRAGASTWNYEGQQVVVVIVQIAIGGPPFAESNIYEAIINEFDESRLARVEDLVNQATLPIMLLNDDGSKPHTLDRPNDLKPFAARALADIAKCEPWTQEAFDWCLEQLYHQFPTRLAKWEKMAD